MTERRRKAQENLKAVICQNGGKVTKEIERLLLHGSNNLLEQLAEVIKTAENM